MNGLFVVLAKEIRENLRDRRAVFNSLLLGPIVFPILFIGLSYFTTSKQQEKAEEVLTVPVIGAEHAPNLVLFLEQQGLVVGPAVDDPEAAVRSQQEAVIVRITEQFPENWNKAQPAPVEVIADASRRESRIPVQRVRQALRGYGREIGALRLQLRGISPTLTSAVQVKDIDLSTPKSRAILALIFLPYVLMITAFTGGMHLAIDSTAGEKERRSLEPLLINPVPRWQVMTGKLIATMLFAFLSLMLTLLVFKFALPYMPVDQLGLDLQLTTETIVRILAVIAPVAILAAALLTMLASFAKSFREAQSYMGLVIFIPMIPSLLFMANPVTPKTWMMAIPLLSQNMLIGELVRGEAVPTLWYSTSIGSTLVIGVLLALITATLYNRPRLVFGAG